MRSGADVVPVAFGTIAVSGGLGIAGSATARTAPSVWPARCASDTGQVATANVAVTVLPDTTAPVAAQVVPPERVNVKFPAIGAPAIAWSSV